jgi:hypothetical protein
VRTLMSSAWGRVGFLSANATQSAGNAHWLSSRYAVLLFGAVLAHARRAWTRTGWHRAGAKPGARINSAQQLSAVCLTQSVLPCWAETAKAWLDILRRVRGGGDGMGWHGRRCAWTATRELDGHAEKRAGRMGQDNVSRRCNV